MNWKFPLIGSLLAAAQALTGATARAGGSVIGNGGNSVVCFSIPAARAYRDLKITPEGWGHLTSAVSYEFYLARHKRDAARELARLTSVPSSAQARRLLMEKIALVPPFRTAIERMHLALGKIEDGLGFKEGLQTVDDAGNAVVLPSNCALIQTVVRQEDQFHYYTPVFQALAQKGGPAQQALLQLHEEIYAYGVRYAKQSTSVPTQLLLVSLMTEPLTKAALAKKLELYGFGHFIDPCTEDAAARQICASYEDLYGRRPQDRELASWRAKLTSNGKSPRAGFPLSCWTHQIAKDTVKNDCQTYMHRWAPRDSFGSLFGWVPSPNCKLPASLDLNSYYDPPCFIFPSSAQDSCPGDPDPAEPQTPTQFLLCQAYSELFGRAPDTGGFGYWLPEVQGKSLACIKRSLAPATIGADCAIFQKRYGLPAPSVACGGKPSSTVTFGCSE